MSHLAGQAGNPLWRRRLTRLLVGSLVLGTTAAVAEPLPVVHSPVVLSPHARRQIYETMGSGIGLGLWPGRLRQSSVSARLLPSDNRLPFLIEVAGGASALERAGFSARPLTNSVAAVSVGASELTRLLSLPGVLRVDGSRRLRPLLDRSRPLTGASFLGDLGVKGKGVLVGIVDTGIDFRHADFKNPDGSTRIAYLLDASTPRSPTLHPEIPDYGKMAVYTDKDINEVLLAEAQGRSPTVRITETDINGHGSHVAGIAAGNGRATSQSKPPGRYVGMAPEASLCIVKGTRDDESFDDADIIDGVRFCFDRGVERKMPVVVNLSLGSAGGAHDGTSALETTLDELVLARPGRVLVAASGNSGQEDLHSSGQLLHGDHEIPIVVDALSQNSGGASGFAIEVFYDTAETTIDGNGGTGSLALELKGPGGRWLKVGAGEALRGELDRDGLAIIDNSDMTASGLRGAIISVRNVSGQATVKDGSWLLRLRGHTRRYDVWMVDSSAELAVKLRGHLDPDGYVELPASARSVISVGAERSRNEWLRADGKTVTFDREIERVAPFSSGGPTRDGRFSPDVIAPGEFIISSMPLLTSGRDPRSAFFTPGDPNFLIADDTVHGVLRGTSQAAPHVAGGVALLFQLQPELDAMRMRELIRQTTRSEGAPSGFGPRRGFGALDVKTALASLRSGPPEPVSGDRSDFGTNYDAVMPEYGTAIITVTPRDARGVPLGPGQLVEITSSAGVFSDPVIDRGGRYERVLQARSPRGSRAVLTARVNGVELSRRVTVDFVADRAEIGAPYQLRGCEANGLGGTSPSPSRALGLLPFLALLGVLRRQRRRLATALSLLVIGSLGCSQPDSAMENPAASTAATGNARRTTPRRYPVDESYWRSDAVLTAPRVQIHLNEQRADIFDGEKLVARSAICSGRRSHKTPTGEFQILEKIPEHVSNRYGDFVDEDGQVVAANIDNHDAQPPPGTYFRGTPMPYFLRITGGVGLHAGPLPGFPDSHGCIRFPEAIAQRLFGSLPIGAPVSVVD